MKKLSEGLLITMLCIALVACGGKPSGMSDDDYETGCEMLDVVDSYLDDDLPKENAARKIKELENEISNMDDHNTYMMYLESGNLVMELLNSSTTKTEIKETRDELAKYLKK